MNYSNSINHQGQASINPHLQDAFSIPVKICDGLFMADRHIAQDVEFFQTNLISHVINCAGQEVQNCRKVADVAFLTFDWSENTIQNITEQKVVSVTVNFIEECRRNAGCLLIHYSQSESRPFCLLACYFMIKFKWSLFKTLQFLNSRKEDVELEPAFFEQLTSFSQKLQEKGLIRSKIWSILPGMSDEEIILTNTYCNSKNKFSSNQNLTGNTKKRPSSASSLSKYSNHHYQKSQVKNVQWKKDLIVEHVYSPHVAIMTLNENAGGRNVRSNSELATNNTSKEKNINANKNSSSNLSSASNVEVVRAQRILSTNNTVSSQNNNKTPNNSSSHKQSSSIPKQESQNIHHNPTPIPGSNINSINNSNNNSAEMNVTKKWAELREMWLKEKQNYHQQQNTSNSSNGGNNNNTNTSLICKKQGQRINDRLQDKLNMLKKHEQKVIQSNNNTKNNRSNNEVRKKKQGAPTSSGKQKQRSLHKDKEQQQQNINSNYNNNENIDNGNKNNNNTGNTNSRIMHNNWIIDNHHLINANNKNDVSSSSNNNGSSNNPATNARDSIKGSTGSHMNKNGGTPNNSTKNNNSKSVIIVKPNHNIEAGNGNQHTGSRSSLRKMNNSQRKEDKENYYKDNHNQAGSGNGGNIAKFFRNQVADIMSNNANNKGRSSSVKPQRKDSMMGGTQNITAMALSKNGSLKGKGKWKF